VVDEASGATRQISTPTFEGTIPGPTLSVEPGDKLSISLVNALPANPNGQRNGAFPHDPYALNLHTHGLRVSPLGISDNIFREMEPGTANQIEVDIPKNHPTGTFWYHPHKHGSVTFQLISGMAGFLIVKGGPGTLDAVPEVAAAKDIVMGFQVIRTLVNGEVAFVQQSSQQFGTFPFPPPPPPIAQQGIWSAYGLDGAPGRSFFYYTTNGVTNPHLHMQPGEVQRWRLLNASDGDNLLVALQGHGLNIVAMDGITVGNMYQLQPGDPVVMGSGQRMDVLVKAGSPGTYLLQTLDPGTDNIAGKMCCSVSPSGIDPAPRMSRHSFDFPTPCSVMAVGSTRQRALSANDCSGMLSYPVTLATIDVSGPPLEMNLPKDPLPVPEGLPSVAAMLEKTPDAVRHVAFELCGNRPGTPMDPKLRPIRWLPSCGWYFAKYDAAYWGNAPFNDLLMMRDDDDKGKPSQDPNMPLVDFKKGGLIDPNTPLFPDMIAGNYEEWTVINRSFSDHPFHIHQNHFLVTKINGTTLPRPEWHDTINVPAAIPNATPGPLPSNADINKSIFGSITFRTYFDPRTVGCFVTHCHTIDHEDIGMMQRVDILPGPGKPSGCVVPANMSNP